MCGFTLTASLASLIRVEEQYRRFFLDCYARQIED